MAVKVISKISNWILIAAVTVSIAVLGMFYFGGEGETIVPHSWNPAYTSTLLTWIFILLGICMAGMLMFGITQFINSFKTNTKKSLMVLGALVGFFLLLILTYTLGDGTPIARITAVESQRFNVPFWLKVIDMWLYSMYALIGLAILAIIWGSIRKGMNK
jgi:hypothetical protein